MRFLEKMVKKQSNICNEKSVTAVFLGDSVTQGCFECFERDTKVDTVFETGQSYSEKLKKILNTLYPSVQVNIINSGISGGSAAGGLERFDRDVAVFSPDLVVLGFALNDCCGGRKEGVGKYKETLKKLITKVREIGAECIVLTPNMMTTSSYDFSSKKLSAWSADFAKVQNEGILDLYVEAAREAAAELHVKLADVYAKWKQMEKYGVNTSLLLANKLNHPNRELHWLTAFVLAETLFEE